MAGLEGPTSHQPFVTPAHRHGPRSVVELGGSLDGQEVTRAGGSNHDASIKLKKVVLMLNSFIIVLREGFESFLLVAIILSYVRKSGQNG